jgi:lipoprotein signal peptidase
VRLAFAAAALVLAATLVHDLAAPSRLSHQRSPVVLAAAGLLAAALLLLAPRVQSHVVTLGAGIAAGGALATLVTGLAWDGGVPNPFARGGVAFNLADVAIAVGDALLVGGALFHSWTSRGRLWEPV